MTTTLKNLKKSGSWEVCGLSRKIGGERKMKKLIAVGLMLVVGASVAFADKQAMLDAWEAKDYDTCITEAEKVIAGNAETPVKAAAQYKLGHCYLWKKDYSKAKTAFEKMIVDYPDEEVKGARVEYYIGRCSLYQEDFTEALSVFESMITDDPSEEEQEKWNADLLYYIVECHQGLGDSEKEQEASLTLCTDYAGINPDLTREVFDGINKRSLGIEGYKDLLNQMIFLIPATPENAEFLGVLKSEQEKMK